MTEICGMRPPWMDMSEFLNAIDLKDAMMAEIGSYQGESTESFAKTGKFLMILAVDSWVDNYSAGDPAALMGNMADVEAAFDLRIKPYPAIKKLKMASINAATFIADHSLDLVYIDANHEYAAVKQDIGLWLPKIKAGGILSGHDYNNPHGGPWIGVAPAVDEMFGKPDAVYFDSSWMVRINGSRERTGPISEKLKD